MKYRIHIIFFIILSTLFSEKKELRIKASNTDSLDNVIQELLDKDTVDMLHGIVKEKLTF